jgi:hypothetical protein
VLAERGFDDDPLPGRQQPAILHGPPAVLVALGLEHQPRGARLVAGAFRGDLAEKRVELRDLVVIDPDDAVGGGA